MTGCEALLTFFGAVIGECGDEPAHPVTKGCLHEHIRDGMLCDFHLGNVGTGMCKPCFDADGHECPIAVVPRESAEVTP
jgi:hypothetical protein